jgi:hypothetical protein
MLFRSLVVVATLLATPALGQDDIRERVAAYVQPTNEARTRIVLDQLRAAGFDPVVETFQGGNPQTGPMEGRNVTTAFGPQTGKEILLVAHYDAAVLRDGELADGVVDNAASVVGVIEAAKRLRERPLTHRVRVILFDQEELGLIGARKWIEAHGLDNVAAVVNSDVAAYGDTLMYGLNNGPQSAEATQALRTVCAERSMHCVGFPVYPPSDDRVFSGFGLPEAGLAGGTETVPTLSVGFQDMIGAHQMWLAFNGGENPGLIDGFMPRVFQVIHSEGDTMDAVEPATVRLAGEVYADIVEQLDAALAN